MILDKWRFLSVVAALSVSSRGCRAFPLLHNKLPTGWSTLHSNQLSKTRRFLSDSQKTLQSGLYEAEMEVKKSRFIGYAQHVTSWEEAQGVIADIKHQHPKARHWCVGFCCGTNPVNERSSDDGEPSGTAGAPILNAIRGADLSDTLVVVVRYFGGIKLGAGGLIRAYGGAARLVLQEAPVQVLIPTSTLQVVVDASYVGAVYEIMGKFDGIVSNEVYGNDGTLSCSILVESQVEDQVKQSLNDATRGTVMFDD